mmetsp:Transcript_1860/g.4144  ORF Transcript_1860/g.4144 Transcript_1860/m.4144 type:complete len:211 (-) Transcript_1860:843-1475(-)
MAFAPSSLIQLPCKSSSRKTLSESMTCTSRRVPGSPIQLFRSPRYSSDEHLSTTEQVASNPLSWIQFPLRSSRTRGHAPPKLLFRSMDSTKIRAPSTPSQFPPRFSSRIEASSPTEKLSAAIPPACILLPCTPKVTNRRNRLMPVASCRMPSASKLFPPSSKVFNSGHFSNNLPTTSASSQHKSHLANDKVCRCKVSGARAANSSTNWAA